MTLSARTVAVSGAAICAVLFAAALRFDDGLPGKAMSGARLASLGPGGDFPRRAVDASGQELVVEAAPQAIASQALTIDHILFAVTDHERIVAVSPYAMDPDYSFVHETVSALSLASSADLEAMLLTNPDLMLLSHRARADFEDILRYADIPTFRVRTVSSDFEQIAAGIAAVGFVTGDDTAAALEIDRLIERIERAKQRRPPAAPAPRVLPYSTFGSTLGKGSLVDHILTELGAVNVASEQGIGPYADISSEQVAAWNPDWIVASSERGDPSRVWNQLLADAGIAVTTAGRTGQILLVDSRQFTTMSQHAVGLMEAIAAGLYGQGK